MTMMRVFIVLFLLLFAGPHLGYIQTGTQASYGSDERVTNGSSPSAFGSTSSSNCGAHDTDSSSAGTGTLGFGSRSQ
jgi:hypothetical protein